MKSPNSQKQKHTYNDKSNNSTSIVKQEEFQMIKLSDTNDINQQGLLRVIKFQKIGHTFALCFDSSSNPIFIIGPHWPLYFVLLIIINTFCIIIYKKFLYYFLTLLPAILYFVLYIGLQITLTLNVILNPGVVYKADSKFESGRHCPDCNAFITERIHAFHCTYCGVCIEDLDHHCIWVGKCVGKKTLKLFYCLIGNVILLYCHLIACVIYYYVKKNSIHTS